jgi:hypothetical protein
MVDIGGTHAVETSRMTPRKVDSLKLGRPDKRVDSRPRPDVEHPRWRAAVVGQPIGHRQNRLHWLPERDFRAK